jgi:uncharacterized membrane protein YoaK (UPF0700 family)
MFLCFAAWVFGVNSYQIHADFELFLDFLLPAMLFVVLIVVDTLIVFRRALRARNAVGIVKLPLLFAAILTFSLLITVRNAFVYNYIYTGMLAFEGDHNCSTDGDNGCIYSITMVQAETISFEYGHECFLVIRQQSHLQSQNLTADLTRQINYVSPDIDRYDIRAEIPLTLWKKMTLLCGSNSHLPKQ